MNDNIMTQIQTLLFAIIINYEFLAACWGFVGGGWEDGIYTLDFW